LGLLEDGDKTGQEGVVVAVIFFVVEDVDGAADLVVEQTSQW
jgi:hypothetical protein